MAPDDLARQARELLSMTGGSASRSLNQLVGLVSRQVPGCSGAASAVWLSGSAPGRDRRCAELIASGIGQRRPAGSGEIGRAHV